MFVGRETLEDHRVYLKRLTNAAFGQLQALCMYGSIGMSPPSLHRKSTDSLILHVHSTALYYNRQRFKCCPVAENWYLGNEVIVKEDVGRSSQQSVLGSVSGRRLQE